ncbi:MAG: hypothetical protein EOP08_14670, partial [Proteobacteria bacterium]
KGVKVSASTTSAKVSWAAVAGAPGYRVMVSPTGSSAGAKYYNVGATSATITGLYSRRTYVFRVSVWNPTAKKRVSPYTAKPMPTARTRAFTAPTGLKLTTRTSTGLRFAWKAQAGAPAYRVMYWETGTTKKRYVTAYKNAVAIKKLKRGGKYQVRVSVFSPGTGERVSAYSAKPYPAGTTLGASGAKAPAPAPKPKPAPAPAPSARNVVKPAGGKVTFKGHGYGHGIGMSQYGAEGGARAGQKYDAILKKYYPGTKLTFKSATIRVQVSADTTNSVQVKHQSGLKLRTLANNAVQALPAKVGSRTVSDWTIDTAPSNRGLNTVSYKSGSAWYAFRTFKSDAQFEGPATIRLVMPNGSTRAYRGALRSAKPTKTTRDTVNVLSDICDTVSCQVYGGYADETKRTNDAILGTKGKILTYQGAPALTQFSSSSGGFTNQGSTPYLKAVSDPWDNWSGNRNHAWSHAVSASAIQKKYPTIGKLTSITVTKRNGHGSLGGRVVSLKLQGSKASRTITGVDARWAFGLKSDWFGF